MEMSVDPMLVLGKAVDMSVKMKGGEFPLGATPLKIQRIIREANECYGFPIDYLAGAMLVVLGQRRTVCRDARFRIFSNARYLWAPVFNEKSMAIIPNSNRCAFCIFCIFDFQKCGLRGKCKQNPHEL